MSSGPSLPKLKPRSATSSCGDDTPRSNSTPSRPARGLVPVAPGRRSSRGGSATRASLPKQLGDARSPRGPCPSAATVLPDPSRSQHAARVTATPERAIQIRAILQHAQAVHDLRRTSPEDGWGSAMPQSSRPSPVTASGRACRRSARLRRCVCRICARCACSLHNSNLLPMPSSTAFFSMPTALRWLAAARCGRCRRARRRSPRRPASAAGCDARAWRSGSALTWSRTFSQTGSRVQPQAAGFVGVVGDDQAIAARARDQLPVGGRNRQPALVVDRDRGLALEHAPPFPTKNQKFPRKPTLVLRMGAVKNKRHGISLGESRRCARLHTLV